METLAPILISSPVRRSGTTLLQRLLCSAPNALIYGENAAHELSMLVNILMARRMQFQYGLESRDQILQRVLEGDTDEWIADLMPPMQNYLQNLTPSYLTAIEYYRDFALQNKRNIWGMKMAEWQAQNLVHCMQTLPDSKLIYIHRGFEGCVASAKSIQMIQNPDDLNFYGNTYIQHLTIILGQVPKDRLLLIDYVELLENPEDTIEKLEKFTSAKGIRKEVMKRRINTFTTDSHQDPSGKGYINPSGLNAEELQLIAAFEQKKTELLA